MPDESDNDESSESEKEKSHKSVTSKAILRIRKKKTLYAFTNGECWHRMCKGLLGLLVLPVFLIVQFALCKQCAMEM